MPSLRKMMDGVGSLALGTYTPVLQPTYKVQDQVVIRKSITRRSPRTQEVIVGTITAFADGGESVVLNIPRPGGVMQRTTVPLDQVEPVKKAFRQSSVQWNPAFRGQM